MSDYGIDQDYERGYQDCREDQVYPLTEEVEQLKTIIENLKAHIRVYEEEDKGKEPIRTEVGKTAL